MPETTKISFILPFFKSYILTEVDFDHCWYDWHDWHFLNDWHDWDDWRDRHDWHDWHLRACLVTPFLSLIIADWNTPTHTRGVKKNQKFDSELALWFFP